MTTNVSNVQIVDFQNSYIFIFQSNITQILQGQSLVNFLHVISEDLFPTESLTAIPTWYWICCVASIFLELQLNVVILTGVILQSLQSHSGNLNLELFRDGNSTVQSLADISITRFLSESEYSASLSKPTVLKDWEFKIFDNSVWCWKWIGEVVPASQAMSFLVSITITYKYLMGANIEKSGLPCSSFGLMGVMMVLPIVLLSSASSFLKSLFNHLTQTLSTSSDSWEFFSIFDLRLPRTLIFISRLFKNSGGIVLSSFCRSCSIYSANIVSLTGLSSGSESQNSTSFLWIRSKVAITAAGGGGTELVSVGLSSRLSLLTLRQTYWWLCKRTPHSNIKLDFQRHLDGGLSKSE